jgi:tetratricopeptide (TPR) repeat protein
MIAKMSDKEKDVFVTNLIQKIEAEEERIKEEKEARELLNQNPLNGNVPAMNSLPGMTGAQKGDWYFYNQTTIAFGLNDFIKKFGTRKLEDNWRRSQKALTNDSQDNQNEKGDELTNEKGTPTKKIKGDDKKKKDFYLKGLPLSDSLLKISNGKIIDAYYNLGSIYKDELGNNKKSIASFEELNKRFVEHKYRPSTYYQLYKIFLSVKNQPQADYYKNKLFNEFPNCEYTQIIKNPNYTVEQTNQKGVVELFYTETFDQYALNNYEKAFELSKESVTKFGKNDFSAKFLYINALCIGKLKGLDSLELALKKLQIFYPKDETAKEAQLILEALYNLKNPVNASGTINKTDTFTLDMQAEHFVVVVCPDDPAIANPFKLALTEFNSNYYSISNLNILNSLFGSAEQITNIKSFKNAEEALRYVDNLKKDKAVFNAKLKSEQFTILAISADNFPRLFRKKKTTSYIPFYIDHYSLN